MQKLPINDILQFHLHLSEIDILSVHPQNVSNLATAVAAFLYSASLVILCIDHALFFFINKNLATWGSSLRWDIYIYASLQTQTVENENPPKAAAMDIQPQNKD